jgi:DNA-binding response OmpR family regulator
MAKGRASSLLRRSKTDRAAAAAEASAGTIGTVLVVNDDEDACELLSRIVERAGGRAVRVADADQAVIALHGDEPVHAIVLDLSSGSASSFGVLDAVRQRAEAGTSLPAVMMIATTSANRTLAFDSGVDEFLTRPFHVDEFTAALTGMLARSPEEREAQREQQSLSSQDAQDL